jgi:hypothetical protein
MMEAFEGDAWTRVLKPSALDYSPKTECDCKTPPKRANNVDAWPRTWSSMELAVPPQVKN